MLKFVVALIVCGAVLVSAQEPDTVDTCIVCQQTADNDTCVYLDNPDPLVEICTTTTGACFSRIDVNTGFIQRGCRSQLDNNTVCEGESCNICQLTRPAINACNINRFPEERLSCYICDGDANSTCANLDMHGNTLHARLCPIFRAEDTCFSTRAGGNVTRGCASSIPSGRCNHGVCGFCRGSNCNSGEFDSLNGAFSVQSTYKILAIAIVFLALIKNA